MDLIAFAEQNGAPHAWFTDLENTELRTFTEPDNPEYGHRGEPDWYKYAELFAWAEVHEYSHRREPGWGEREMRTFAAHCSAIKDWAARRAVDGYEAAIRTDADAVRRFTESESTAEPAITAAYAHFDF